MDLKSILNVEKWQKVQDALAAAIGLAIITVDYRGIPITEHSGCQLFCQAVRNDSMLSKNCQKCDSRGGLEAARLNRPYVYVCHYDVVDAAIPILMDDKYMGALMIGQVLLSDQQEMNRLESICMSPSHSEACRKRHELNGQYQLLPKRSYDSVKTAVEMLFHLCNYIFEEAMEKNVRIQTYENMLRRQKMWPISFHPSHDAFPPITNARNEIVNALSEPEAGAENETFYCYNPALKPAFEYIHDQANQKILQSAAASLCHISSSYFSRLFVQETGMSFREYVSNVKMTWAKQLLKTTDMTIAQISEEMGYQDAGYFIKLFKKCEGVTPLVYRQLF